MAAATATITRGANSVVLTLDMRVNVTIGKPSLKIWPTGQSAPRASDVRSPSHIFEISGNLSGASAYTDMLKLQETIIMPPLSTSPLTLTFTGLAAVAGPYNVFPYGGMSCKCSLKPGQTNQVDVQLALIEVSNT